MVSLLWYVAEAEDRTPGGLLLTETTKEKPCIGVSRDNINNSSSSSNNNNNNKRYCFGLYAVLKLNYDFASSTKPEGVFVGRRHRS